MTPRPGKFLSHPLKEIEQGMSGWSMTQILNWLQERGQISDLCVTMEDVAHVDAARVVERWRAKWQRKPLGT